MAYIFPSSPVGVLPATLLWTFQFLKGLPANYVIWHHLAPWEKEAPDFLILNSNQYALLMKVSSANPVDARPAAQLLLLEDIQSKIGEVEEKTLQDFLDRFQDADLAANLPTMVLFPNIPSRQLNESRPKEHPRAPVWLGREMIQPESIPVWDGLFIGRPFNQVEIDYLRARFTPEVVVPPALTVRTPTQRMLEAGLTDHLLDYNQEAALKADLDLPSSGQGLSRDFRLNLVNGVAGSGKTLILLYRLRLLYELYPGKRFLVLTHNRPLNFDMQSRFHRLCGNLPVGISWDTFQGWCYKHWPPNLEWHIPLGIDQRDRVLRGIWASVFKDDPVGKVITEYMLHSEIDWFKDQLVMDQDQYMNMDRRGRGFRLSREQRELMYTAIIRYEAALKQQNAVDWGDIPRCIWEFIQSDRIQLPEYDFILVDEAQFFAPLWFEIIQRLLKPHSSHLFLAADPSQGFLHRGLSWKSLGMEVRGHSYHLNHSYRTTLEILNFATLFYRQRIPQEPEDDEVLAPDLLNMPNGATPYLIHLDSPQDEIARIANEIAALLNQGVPRSDILVLHTHWQGVDSLIQSLDRKIGRGTARDPKDTYPGNYVRVTTLNAGTGLESPIVFLLGLQELFEEEHSLRLSDEEREHVILENTRKIYMAITRAGQRLVFTYIGQLPDALKRLFVKT